MHILKKKKRGKNNKTPTSIKIINENFLKQNCFFSFSGSTALHSGLNYASLISHVHLAEHWLEGTWWREHGRTFLFWEEIEKFTLLSHDTHKHTHVAARFTWNLIYVILASLSQTCHVRTELPIENMDCVKAYKTQINHVLIPLNITIITASFSPCNLGSTCSVSF